MKMEWDQIRNMSEKQDRLYDISVKVLHIYLWTIVGFKDRGFTKINLANKYRYLIQLNIDTWDICIYASCLATLYI